MQSSLTRLTRVPPRVCLRPEIPSARTEFRRALSQASVRPLIAAGAPINCGAAVLRCLANMSSREPSGLRMYDGDAAVGGARERASRCRRPGFHESPAPGSSGESIRGRVSPGSLLSGGGVSHLSRRVMLFIRIARRRPRRVYSTPALDVYSAPIYLFAASTTDCSRLHQ